MTQPQKPDYTWWAKMDSWSLQEAALLLHDVNPHAHLLLQLGDIGAPSKLGEAQRTYWLLQSTAWKERYPYHPAKKLHPLAVVLEAASKNLPLPKQLHDTVIERFKYTELLAEKSTGAKEASLSTRERRAFLKAIGILVKLLLDTDLGKRAYVRGQKPSAFQITQLLLEKAEALGMETEGLKSMDRKITEALELLAEESLAP